MTGLEKLDGLSTEALADMHAEIARSLLDRKNPDPVFWGERLREVGREYLKRTTRK